MDFNLSPRSNSSHIAMHVFRGLPSPLQRIPSAVAIGNFDGVHTGHQALLAGLVALRQSQATARLRHRTHLHDAF